MRYFSRSQVRRLGAEQPLDAVCHVTGVSESFADMPVGTCATQLPSPDVGREFLRKFGAPKRATAFSCERSTAANHLQGLELVDGDLVPRHLAAKDNRIARLVDTGKSNDEVVSQLCLLAFLRNSQSQELAVTDDHIAAHSDRLEGLQDVCYALLNTKEFLFQH
ncbi:MAG: hypothetical protein MK538_07735 [Planctomycetes bacterium]|nr:hypothetical protein [Planctomycetota bacterium]